MRVKQYKDDLQVSCLSLILSLPYQLIRDDMALIIPAIKVKYNILELIAFLSIGLAAVKSFYY